MFQSINRYIRLNGKELSVMYIITIFFFAPMGLIIVVKFRVFTVIVANKVEKGQRYPIKHCFQCQLGSLIYIFTLIGYNCKANSKFCDDRENYGRER